MSQTQPHEPFTPPPLSVHALAKLDRDAIVYAVVIEARSHNLRSTLRSDQIRALRKSAETFAEHIDPLDAVAQRIVMGMVANRGSIPEGAMLEHDIEEAKLVSATLRTPLGPYTDAYGRNQQVERPARLLELMTSLTIQIRATMDQKTRMAQSGCRALRDRCHKLAEQLLELEPELQEVVVLFCVRSGITEGSQLQTYIDQARMLLTVLTEEYPPPQAHPQS